MTTKASKMSLLAASLDVTSDSIDVSAKTGSLVIPNGTSAQRPSIGLTGMVRVNTSTKNIEYFNGNAWNEISVFTPATLSGLSGWYDLQSVSGTTWLDKSGNGRNATISGASISNVSGNGSSLITSALHGSSSSHSVSWSSSVIPDTYYTLFHVTRYTGTSNLRIHQAEGLNWLSGHWNGLSGVCFHNGWLTQSSSSIHGNNWVISSDQWDLYRSNGVQRSVNGGGTRITPRLVINTGSGLSEFGTWMTVECIVYNRVLSISEIQQVELYLASRYGIALG